MSTRLRNIKYRLVAAWWLLTRKNYYLLSYNGRVGKSLQSYNVIIPEFIEWLKQRNGLMTNSDLIRELKSIGTLVKDDALAYLEVKDLIEKLRNERGIN